MVNKLYPERVELIEDEFRQLIKDINGSCFCYATFLGSKMEVKFNGV